METCGGDCFEYFSRNLAMSWYTVEAPQGIESDQVYSSPEKSRPCTPEDIGQKQYDTGLLYICPPLDGNLKMQGKF